MITQVEFVDKCRLYHDGRKEVSFYIVKAGSEEEAKQWVKENVFFQPYVVRSYQGENGHWILEVEEWVD